MRKKLLLALVLPFATPACQTLDTWGPTWSEVSGQRYVGGILYRRPAIIEHIDQRGAFNSDPIKVEPGKHAIQVSAPTPGWPGGSNIQVMNLDLEPCKTYYLNAQFENNVSQDWTPVIDYVQPIPGCVVPTKKS